MNPTRVYRGEALSRYGFGDDHPFGPDRHDAFLNRLKSDGLADRVSFGNPDVASREQIETFHGHRYVERVLEASQHGHGYLDAGDTPAFEGVYEVAATVVGTTLAAVRAIMSGECKRAFVPIAGLHHAGRGHAAGFCVFNDCGVAAEILRSEYGIERVAYVDIDAHHGDGVYYGFEDEAFLIFADIHEDGRCLYPGTGHEIERGTGEAAGTKLNIPMPPGATDEYFFEAWDRVEAFLEQHEPQFFILQAGADSLAGDPITHLNFTEAAHSHAARRLCELADRYAEGRLLALGGGGYNRDNLARAWTAVVQAMVEAG
ncbi:MAG: acetoin utilization protein AcuC [Gammaproteobacteria bacterium]